MKTLFLQIGIFVCNVLSKLAAKLPQRNPAIIEEKYYGKNRGKIDTIVERQKRKTEDAQMAGENQMLLDLAKKFAVKANRLWGKSRINDYKAAWYNVLAAQSYQAAKSHKQAGGFFHFAAHVFRNL
jgi:hypothetical protein